MVMVQIGRTEMSVILTCRVAGSLHLRRPFKCTSLFVSNSKEYCCAGTTRGDCLSSRVLIGTTVCQMALRLAPH